MPHGVISGQSRTSDHLVAFDLETTGLSPRSDRILEIGAVRYDRALRPIDELQVIVDPQMPIPLAIQRLVGLTDDDVRRSAAARPRSGVAARRILRGRGTHRPRRHVRSALPARAPLRDVRIAADLRHARPRADPAADLREPQPPAPEPPPRDRPRAPAPCPERCPRDRRAVSGPGRRRPEPSRSTTRARCGGSHPRRRDRSRRSSTTSCSARRWTPSPPVDHAAASAAPPPMRDLPMRACRRVRTGAASARPRPRCSAPTGPLAARDGYEYREAQLQMAMAVGQTLERRRRLMVEAGTGVGKSLAYLDAARALGSADRQARGGRDAHRQSPGTARRSRPARRRRTARTSRCPSRCSRGATTI